VVIMSEVALVTPPIGANVFVMRRAAPELPMTEIFMGVLPFVVGELVMVSLLIAFPEIATSLCSPGRDTTATSRSDPMERRACG
jgi:TRAP-type C4-dicarboxylate transport system permease large subunit